MVKRIVFTAMCLALLVLVSPLHLSATPVTGTASFGGSSATFGITSVTFNCNPGITFAPCPAPPPATGNGDETTGDMSFAPYVTQGINLRSLSQATTPLNQAFSLQN